MSESRPELSEIIIGFLEALPATIKTEVFLFVLLYGFDIDPPLTDSQAFLPLILDNIRKTGGLKRMSATIRTVAALDYILWRSSDNIRNAESTIKDASQLNPELRAQLLTGYPMRRKHYDIALADWTKLRATQITPQSLSDYEDTLQGSRFREQ